ncbi:CDPK-related kinase 3-like [Zingiber officinale]|uniref:CDPK-related kinase 3-like n=1 Tax=Zingiber officinale TaxID=94328 RepID=UPI001C4C6D54|nr:CDPK-related kinase 3-like [Zingiber officinale]
MDEKPEQKNARGVKDVASEKMTTPISIEDVRREVKILKALSNHNNLVKFYDACEDALNVYVIMELCEGGELLERILSRGGRYLEEDAKAIVIQIVSVIAFCHLQGVVHRDLNPENFLFTTRDENAQMKLIDFGLSNFVKPALSKALIEDQLFYLRSQFKLLAPNGEGHISFDNFRMGLLQNATEAMKEGKVIDILNVLEPLSYRKMDFEEFCAATISPHHLEALDGWEQMTSTAFEHFELEGKRAITVKELAQRRSLQQTRALSSRSPRSATDDSGMLLSSLSVRFHTAGGRCGLLTASGPPLATSRGKPAAASGSLRQPSRRIPLSTACPAAAFPCLRHAGHRRQAVAGRPTQAVHAGACLLPNRGQPRGLARDPRSVLLVAGRFKHLLTVGRRG